MITADRVACHDIGIVTVPKDYNVCLEQPTSNMVNSNILLTQWFMDILFSLFLSFVIDALKVSFS